MAGNRFNPRIPMANTSGLLALVYDPSFQEEEEEAPPTESSIDEEEELQIVREEDGIPEFPNPPAPEIELADYQKTDWGKRPPWNPFKERWMGPLKGKLDPMHKHDLHWKMIASYDYDRRTVLPHVKPFTPCRTQIVNAFSTNLLPAHRLMDATSGLEFDPTGEFLASVNRVGCLTIQRFQTLRCYSDHIVPNTGGGIWFSETVADKIDVFHVNSAHEFEAVRWNSVKQNQVACASMLPGEVLIYDLPSFSPDPLMVLRPNRGTRITDVAFNGSDDSRLYGSGLNGIVNVWDPRTSYLPCLELVTHEMVHDILELNSIQLHLDNQKVFGGDRSGHVFMWDIRNPSMPAGEWSFRQLFVTLGYIPDNFMLPLGCHSILINPNRRSHIAFHLALGWSGILEFESSKISHLQGPPAPPPMALPSHFLYMRKPSWLLDYSMFVVGRAYGTGIDILDFFPDSSSTSYVERHHQNRYIATEETITATATHPRDGALVAATPHSSLILFPQAGAPITEPED